MPDVPDIAIEPPVEETVRLGWFLAHGVDPTACSPLFEEELEALAGALRQRYPDPASAVERNRPARVLYRGVGIDPTKHRPSSEALLRRVLSGKPLYRVNTVVDAANLWSLGAALPVGLYDVERLKGALRAGLGAEGEGYQGISKGRINVEGRLMLRDSEGPFGNPSADSWRTRVQDDTSCVLFVIFAPAMVGPGEMERLATEAAVLMSRHVGGAAGPVRVAPVKG